MGFCRMLRGPAAVALKATLLACLLGACQGGGTAIGTGGGVQPTSLERASSAPSTDPLEVQASHAASGRDAPLEPEMLVARVQGLLASERRSSAAELIRAHPETALRVLALEPDPRSHDAVYFIARVHDAQCGSRGRPNDWAQYLQVRERVEGCRICDRTCAEIRRCLREGVLKSACQAARGCTPVRCRGAEAMWPEVARLEGVSLLLDGRAHEAAEAFRRGVDLTARDRPYQHAHLLLLESEARRRSGDGRRAHEAWRQALALAARLHQRDPMLPDPGFWERAAHVREPDWHFPEALVPALASRQAPVLRGHGAAIGPEGLVWITVARQRLERQEPQGALKAFSRAEPAQALAVFSERARLGQARALVHLGEPGRAQAMLAALAGSQEPSVSSDAMSVWGTLELELGHVDRGLGLLEKSAELQGSGGDLQWQTEANLALALLMEGSEQEGLVRLHAAQQVFQAERRVGDWIRSLENELAYLQGSDARSVEIARVREELTRAERG